MFEHNGCVRSHNGSARRPLLLTISVGTMGAMGATTPIIFILPMGADNQSNLNKLRGSVLVTRTRFRLHVANWPEGRRSIHRTTVYPEGAVRSAGRPLSVCPERAAQQIGKSTKRK